MSLYYARFSKPDQSELGQALAGAAYGLRHDIAELLIAHGAPSDPITDIQLGRLDKAKAVLDRNSSERKKLAQSINQLFYESASRGDVAACLFLLKRGADVNYKFDDRETPLGTAISNRETEMALALIGWGARVGEPSGWSQSPPLALAASVGDIKVMEKLLAEGADSNQSFGKCSSVEPNPEADCTVTPLHSAARACQVETTRLLLRHGAKINARSGQGDTALHLASERPCPEVAKLLLEKGADISATGSYGGTALNKAAGQPASYDVTFRTQWRKPEMDELGARVCRLLIEAGADVNAPDKGGAPPIIQALMANRFQTFSVLLDAGAAIPASLTSAAAGQHDIRFMEALISKGADLDARDEYGRAAIHTAFGPAMIKSLLDHGADPNCETSGNDKRAGRTALFTLYGDAIEESFRLLIEHGADVNHRSKSGMTPLHDLALMHELKAMMYLLEKGADPTVADNEQGRTPFHLLFERRFRKDLEENPLGPLFFQTMSMLIEHGADINAVDAGGKTPLDCAAGMPLAVEFLTSRGAVHGKEITSSPSSP